MIHHDGSALHVPDQQPSLGDTVDVIVRVSPDAGVDRVWVRTTPDAEPRFAPATPQPRAFGGVSEIWFHAKVWLRNPVSRYRFLLDGSGGYRWLTAAGVVHHDVADDTDFRIVCGAPPPAWAAEAVVYLIFPDRFDRSPDADGRRLPDWAIARAWTDKASGEGPGRAREIFGGDLDGIRLRLDHIAATGANTICLTPIFTAPANHRYCPSTFYEVDPLLGGNEALSRLADAVHARGMRLIGDLTTNHTGDQHEWFLDAAAGRHQDIYYFDPALPYGYETWVGVRRMPKLNWGSRELRRRMFDGPESVVRRWLDAALDGWRVDVANTTGRAGTDDFTHAVAAQMLESMRRSRPDALLIAEHSHDASTDMDSGGWHGTINYAGFTRPVWTWLSTVPLPFQGVPVGVPRLSGNAAVATMQTFGSRMSWRSRCVSWSCLDSHDTPRFRTLVGGDAQLAEIGIGLMATLPGTPVIYAGDELGLEGSWAEDARRPIPWHEPGGWNQRTLANYRALTALRAGSQALRHGGLRFVHAGEDMIIYARETAAETMLILAARSAAISDVVLPGDRIAVNVYGGASDLAPGDKLTATEPTFQVWRVDHDG